MNIFTSLDPSVKKLLGWKLGDEEEKWVLKAVESLVKKLRKRRAFGTPTSGCAMTAAGGCGTVEDLEYALAHPGSHSKCVTIPRSLDGRLQVSHRKGLPHVIYCRVWRWPNLQSHHELRPTPDCAFPYNSRSEFICVNPYHYQRVESALGMTRLSAQPTPAPSSQRNDSTNFFGIQQHQGSMGSFPVCSSAESSYSNYSNSAAARNSLGYYSQQQIQQEQCGLYQQQQQFYMPGLGSVFSANTSSQNTIFNAPPPRCLSSRSASSASSVTSAQSPSALSDDDDFAAQRAAAALAAASAASVVAPTGGAPSDTFLHDYWCSISYYELNSRVGELFKISSPEVTVDGFTDPSNDEARICLGLLSNVNRNNTIECTRRHIGRGIRLTCTESSVIVLNQSESPVFVQSRNSNFKYGLQSTAVCRVPSGASIVIFDFALFRSMLEKARQEDYNHVYDLQKMCFIRMSFVKGWGVDYHRQDVTSTPCWIEIQLHRPLAWIDVALAPMNPPDHLNITSVS